jgi:hypothetical protein
MTSDNPENFHAEEITFRLKFIQDIKKAIVATKELGCIIDRIGYQIAESRREKGLKTV